MHGQDRDRRVGLERFGELLDTSIDARRRLLMLQGWRGAELEQALTARPADRLAPAFCMTGAAVGGLLGSPALLTGLGATGVVGAVTGRHPVERIHAWLVPDKRLPPARAGRRFACALAAAWTAAAVTAHVVGRPRLSRGLALSLSAAAGVYTSAGFCLPSTVLTAALGTERATCPTLAAAVSRATVPTRTHDRWRQHSRPGAP